MGSHSCPHFVVFPFMSQGHTIPLLSLCRLIRRRTAAAVTLFTTVQSAPHIRCSLQNVDVSIIELPFPPNINSIPPGVENTDKLPSMSCFFPFLKSTKSIQNRFEKARETLSRPISCIISEGFLYWNKKPAEKFGVPRFVFIGMGNFSCLMYHILARERPQKGAISPDEPFPIPDFPKIMLMRNDFEPPFNELEPAGEFVQFMAEESIATAASDGVIVNSFYEMESCYVDCWNEKIGPKVFCVGPLCMAPPPPEGAREKQGYN